MAQAIPNAAAQRTSELFARLTSATVADRGECTGSDETTAAGTDSWVEDEEMDANAPNNAVAGRHRQVDPTECTPVPAEPGLMEQELQDLRADNERLRAAVVELEQLLNQSGGGDAADWEEKQKEYESLLEEKSEVIRALHVKMQDMQERPTAATPREEELLALSEELERERRQLKDDEETLMQQMREMEIQMSRERAEMARQRTELTRLHNEIQHELENAARDGTLRERLAPLQRRHQELLSRGGTAPLTESSTPEAAVPRAGADFGAKDPGFFRRLFK